MLARLDFRLLFCHRSGLVGVVGIFWRFRCVFGSRVFVLFWIFGRVELVLNQGVFFAPCFLLFSIFVCLACFAGFLAGRRLRIHVGRLFLCLTVWLISLSMILCLVFVQGFVVCSIRRRTVNLGLCLFWVVFQVLLSTFLCLVCV